MNPSHEVGMDRSPSRDINDFALLFGALGAFVGCAITVRTGEPPGLAYFTILTLGLVVGLFTQENLWRVVAIGLLGLLL
jgi:hypothetical protein